MRTHYLTAYLVALLAIVVLTLVLLPFRAVLTIANVTMFMLLLVFLMALSRGTLPALLTTIAGFLCINYFFIPPYYDIALNIKQIDIDTIPLPPGFKVTFEHATDHAAT